MSTPNLKRYKPICASRSYSLYRETEACTGMIKNNLKIKLTIFPYNHFCNLLREYFRVQGGSRV